MRIIGGQHRRRVLHFPSLPGLRPTPDRVRETLFNWLGQRLDELRCLDLFAGSGALGFEAASRGAREVVLVEQEAKAVASLRENARVFAGSRVEVVRADAVGYLAGDCGVFDVIFLDPAFASDLLPRVLPLAATHLAPGGRIYAEFGDRLDTSGWHVLREGRAGHSHYCLLERP